MIDKTLTFKDVQEFITKLDYSAMIAYEEGEWCLDGDDYYWVDKLETYSGYATEGSSDQEDMHLVNLDIQQGYWITYVFKLENKLSYEEFCNKHEDQM